MSFMTQHAHGAEELLLLVPLLCVQKAAAPFALAREPHSTGADINVGFCCWIQAPGKLNMDAQNLAGNSTWSNTGQIFQQKSCEDICPNHLMRLAACLDRCAQTWAVQSDPETMTRLGGSPVGLAMRSIAVSSTSLICSPALTTLVGSNPAACSWCQSCRGEGSCMDLSHAYRWADYGLPRGIWGLTCDRAHELHSRIHCDPFRHSASAV